MIQALGVRTRVSFGLIPLSQTEPGWDLLEAAIARCRPGGPEQRLQDPFRTFTACLIERDGVSRFSSGSLAQPAAALRAHVRTFYFLVNAL